MSENSQKDIKDTAKGQGDLVFLKSHKLAAALYAVTNFMADGDPLKWRLRETSLDLLAEVERSGLRLPVDLMVKNIDRLVALIDIAKLGSNVSEMNLAILRREYLNLAEKIKLGKEEVLPWLELPSELPAPLASSTAQASKKLAPKSPIPASKPQTAPPHSDRAEVILGFIKARGWSSIKDIAASFPNYSTKTVQRELSALVQAGRLRREGDRRWARYNLLD